MPAQKYASYANWLLQQTVCISILYTCAMLTHHATLTEGRRRRHTHTHTHTHTNTHTHAHTHTHFTHHATPTDGRGRRHCQIHDLKYHALHAEHRIQSYNKRWHGQCLPMQATERPLSPQLVAGLHFIDYRHLLQQNAASSGRLLHRT
jgi:hypothetical protein